MSTILIAEPAQSALTGVSPYLPTVRWLFFAKLLVIPYLLNLTITSSNYLFKDEIDHSVVVYRYIAQPADEPSSHQKIADIAAEALAMLIKQGA